MNNIFHLDSDTLFRLAWPGIIFFLTLAIGLLVRKLIFIEINRWAAKTDTKVDDIVVAAVRRPFVIWCVMLSVYIALAVSKLPAEYVALSGKTLVILGIMSVTLVLANIASGLITLYSGRGSASLPTTSLTQNVARILIVGIGALIILNSLGISIAPILATLGVGGLAVALALQEPLSNLFAGFNIIMAKQIRPGDYVKLESGQEGYVTDIAWRSTRIRMLANNVIIVPNTKLAQTVIINHHLPEKELAVLVELGVHYESDLALVERVTCSVGKEVMDEVAGGVSAFTPFIRFHTFGDYCIKFTAILRAQEFVDQYLIKHEFIKRIHARYKKEGITIPYPIVAINKSQEHA